ncbi:MAG: RNA polymerase sigma factor [Planctomycetaceae bacterium]|nr:RNA polymerase sigma factor [Planctomycetaceae bacterium]
MTDEQLVASYLHTGNRDALGQLIDRNVGRVRRVVYPMVLNHADADDVVQEVFVRVVRGLGSFRQEAQFATWLRRVTMNTVYRFLKQRQRTRTRLVETASAVEPPCDCRPEQSALDGELDEVIGHALEQLSPELRGALVMTVFDEVTPAELATIEGCSRATIYWRVHRARRAMKKLLKDWV